MQNLQNNKAKLLQAAAGGAGVFQNNFLLPKASPNAGMLKTFYNSKQSTGGGVMSGGAGSTTGSSHGGA